MIKTITLIGAGNLATQLGLALSKNGIGISQVYSRTEESASNLASKLNCTFTSVPSEINTKSDLLLIAIKDDAIMELLGQINVEQSFIAHTAGSVPMSFLTRYSSNCGVFYPLQTFSKSRELEFDEIPICIEANTLKGLKLLEELGLKVSKNVKEVNSDERGKLHLSAVISCNFVNHFYHLGHQVLAEEGLDFDLLKPLIKETAAKVMDLNPAEAQTGPAIRFDETIINKHLKMLEGQDELRKIYSFVSESIYKTHKKNQNGIF